MGDRANIYLVDSDPSNGIYLYTHWDGYEWPEMLRQALEMARGRWGDQPYSARIIIREMFATYDGDTGGGISTFLSDNQHSVTVVDLTEQTVSFAKEGEEINRLYWTDVQSFAEYVAQTEARYPANSGDE